MHQRRERIIRLVKRRLLRKGSPRLLVSLILLVTGLAGFLVSFSLLHTGMTRMWLRYPLAILFAYCVFLLLLRLWLSLLRSRNSGLDVDFQELPSLDIDVPQSPGYSESFRFSGGGGDAGGAGAGGSWGQSAMSSSSSSGSGASGSSSSGGGSSGGGIGDLDLEEGWLIVIALAAVAAAFVAILYVVYAAPALLAEILVDGVLMAGLYRKLKGIEQRHWLRAAVRQTILPALIAALLFSLAGYAMQRAAPKARSIGEVWKYLVKD